MGIIYRLWAGAILEEERKRGAKTGRFYALFFITFCQGFNLASILFFSKIIFKYNFKLFISVDFFNGKILNGALSGFITLIAPFLIINYFLVFWNNRYFDCLKKYPSENSKIYNMYFILSLLVFLIPLLFGFLISRI
jgi:hypothetical protein